MQRRGIAARSPPNQKRVRISVCSDYNIPVTVVATYAQSAPNLQSIPFTGFDTASRAGSPAANVRAFFFNCRELECGGDFKFPAKDRRHRLLDFASRGASAQLWQQRRTFHV